MENSLRILWELVMQFIHGVGNVWNWLTDSHFIGISLFGIFEFGLNVVPLYWILGAGFLVAITMHLVKTFVPVA